MKDFKGRLMGVEYDSPTLFEQTAKSLGFRVGKGRSTSTKRKWAAGTPIAVLIDGERISGQVWSQADRQGYVWVALDTGRYVAVYTPTLTVSADTGNHRRAPAHLGKVA